MGTKRRIKGAAKKEESTRNSREWNIRHTKNEQRRLKRERKKITRHENE